MGKNIIFSFEDFDRADFGTFNMSNGSAVSGKTTIKRLSDYNDTSKLWSHFTLGRCFVFYYCLNLSARGHQGRCGALCMYINIKGFSRSLFLLSQPRVRSVMISVTYPIIVVSPFGVMKSGLM